MTEIAPSQSPWNGIERRKPHSCRRQGERRCLRERRCDTRDQSRQRRRSLYSWLRSLFKTRLGVDRRKNVDQRTIQDRRRMNASALLTKEELDDLLK